MPFGSSPWKSWSLRSWVAGFVLLAVLPSCARFCSAQIDEASVDNLIEQSSDRDDEDRRDALYELVRRQLDSDKVVRAFADRLDDGDVQVRFQALLGLSRAGEASELAIPELLRCLSDRDDQVRYRAADALGKIGPKALPDILKAWENSNSTAQLHLLQAVSTMGPKANSIKDKLLILLLKESNAETQLQQAVAQCLASISPEDEELLLAMTSHAKGVVRELGIRGLAGLKHSSEKTEQALVAAAQDEDPKVRELGIIAVAKSSLQLDVKRDLISKSLIDASASVRSAALTALRKAKSKDAKFSLPLIQLFQTQAKEESSDGSSLMPLLKAIAAEAAEYESDLPVLLDVALETNFDREMLSQIIGKMSPEAIEVILANLAEQPKLESYVEVALVGNAMHNPGAIRNGLNDSSSVVRSVCAMAITEVEPVSEETIQSLVAMLQDSSEDVKIGGIRAFAKLAQQPNAELDDDTFEKIFATGSDDIPKVRKTLMTAMVHFSADSEREMAVLRLGLKDKDAAVRATALASLSLIPKQLNSLKPELLAACNDSNKDVRMAALRCLAAIPKSDVGKSDTEAMLLALGDSETAVRTEATLSLITQDLGDPALRESLIDALCQNLVDDVDLLRASLEALEIAGHEASSAANTVTALLQHPKEDIRVAAVKALREIEPKRELLAERLMLGLDDDQWAVRQASAQALGTLGEVAKVAIPKLFAKLGDEEDEDFARGAIRDIDAAPIEVLPQLLESLESENRRIQFYAIFLAGKIGPEAKEALPILKAMREKGGSSRRFSFIRKSLNEAIESIEAIQEQGEESQDDG